MDPDRLLPVVEFDSEIKLPLNALTLRLDDTTTANVTYVGYGGIGAATSAATWRIKKLDETTGLVITWADGNRKFDNVWDNRASLSYS